MIVELCQSWVMDVQTLTNTSASATLHAHPHTHTHTHRYLHFTKMERAHSMHFMYCSWKLWLSESAQMDRLHVLGAGVQSVNFMNGLLACWNSESNWCISHLGAPAKCVLYIIPLVACCYFGGFRVPTLALTWNAANMTTLKRYGERGHPCLISGFCILKE